MLCNNEDRQRSKSAFAGWLGSTNGIAQQFLAMAGRPDVISLAGGLPASEFYPLNEINAALQRALKRRGNEILEYGDVEGLHDLRALIAQRTAAETGGNFTVDNVLITTGSSQALDLLGKIFLDIGDLIITQTPTYLGALDAWRTRSPRYEQLNWSKKSNTVANDFRNAKFVYVVPNFSNPTGVLVPSAQRAALLKQVRHAGTWIVEDDPYKTINFASESELGMLTLDVSSNIDPYAGQVISLGTLSKTIAPGLRVGWIIAESGVIKKLALAKQASVLSGSLLNDALAYELLSSHADTELARITLPAYRERRDRLCDAARDWLSEWFEWEVPLGGMFLWMRAKDNAIDTDALYPYAINEKVAYVPSSAFDFSGADRHGMRLNFTRSEPDSLTEGIRRLAAAIRFYLEDASRSKRGH